MNIQVATDALVAHAQERYEDAIVCDGARRFITYVGNVPMQAFGQLPWSAQWQQDWATARDARFTEATNIRNVLANTGGALYQVAADYTDADITSAIELDVQVNDLAVFVDGGVPPHTFHPGDNNYAPPAATVDGSYVPRVGNNDRLKWMQLSGGVGQPRFENVDQVSDTDRAEQYYGDSEGKKALTTFINDWGMKLSEIESVVQTISPGIATPMENEITVAWKCWPKILSDRADMFHSLAQTYKEIRDEYAGELQRLRSYWYSPGAAAAYFDHSNVVLNYLDTIEAEAKWLAEEGKKCADVIDRLQLAYANLGHEHIQNILDHYQTYLDELNDLTTSGNPAEALANAFNAFATEIINQQSTSSTEAQNRLQLSQTVLDNQPDLGTRGHSAEVFPQIEGGNSWQNGDGWVPKENPTPAPVG